MEKKPKNDKWFCLALALIFDVFKKKINRVGVYLFLLMVN